MKFTFITWDQFKFDDLIPECFDQKVYVRDLTVKITFYFCMSIAAAAETQAGGML